MQPLPSLKYYRERRMITQRELAERSGIGRATIARLETTNTKATPRVARALAEVLEVVPQTLTRPPRRG